MKRILSLIFISSILSLSVYAQAPISEKLADTTMNRIWVDSRDLPGIPPKWTYEQGVVHKAIEQMWYATGDPKYFRHIQRAWIIG